MNNKEVEIALKERKQEKKEKRRVLKERILFISDIVIVCFLLCLCFYYGDLQQQKVAENNIKAKTENQPKQRKGYEKILINTNEEEIDYYLSKQDKEAIKQYVISKYPDVEIYCISGPLKRSQVTNELKPQEREQVWVVDAVNARYVSSVDTEEFLVYVRETEDKAVVEVVDQFHRPKEENL